MTTTSRRGSLKPEGGRRLSITRIFPNRRISFAGILPTFETKAQRRKSVAITATLNNEPKSPKKLVKKNSLFSFFGVKGKHPDVINDTTFEEVTSNGLSEELQNVARKELNETYENRLNGLSALKNHIKNASYIIKCKTDEEFLLRFLRAKKFRTENAIELLDKYLAYRTKYVTWFKTVDVRDPRVAEAIGSGMVLPLPEKDQHSRTVILLNSDKLGCTKDDFVNIMWTVLAIGEFVLLDEEAQIRGVTILVDASHLGWSHLSGFPIYETLDALYAILTVAPVRYRAIHIFGAKKVFMPFITIFKNLLPHKLKKRLVFHSSWKDFTKTGIPVHVLPSEFGGRLPTQVIISDVMRQLEEHREFLLELGEMRVDEKLAQNTKVAALAKATTTLSYMARFKNALF